MDVVQRWRACRAAPRRRDGGRASALLELLLEKLSFSVADPEVDLLVEFDRCAVCCEDFLSWELELWAAKAGSWPRSTRAQMPDSTWKNKPDRDLSVLEAIG